MATFSRTTCQQKLDEYLAAETAVLSSQSYSIGGRTLTRANLAEIRKGVEVWNDRLAAAIRSEALGGGRIFCRRVIPHG